MTKNTETALLKSTQVATRELGGTGLSVSVLGLGGAPLGELFEAVSEQRAQAILRTAWAGNIRFYDTAPWYGHGQSEHRMGTFLRQQRRDQFVLSTKVGRVYRPARDPAHRTPPWVGGLPFVPCFDYSYDGVMRSWEDSLMRLGLNQVELLVIHDLDTGYHGSGSTLDTHRKNLESGGWRALEKLKSSGAIRGIGAGINDDDMIPWFLDNFPLDFLLIAIPYTLLDQSALEYALPSCLEKGVSVVIGSPYASGILATGAVEAAVYNYAPADPAIKNKTRRIQAVCESHGVSLQAAALQFPLGHPSVVSVIPGATEAAQIRANLQHLSVRIPHSLWIDLIGEKLLCEQAPLPSTIRSSK